VTSSSDRQSPRRRVEESGAVSTDGGSDEFRAARDIFVRQSPRRRVEESGAVSTDGGSDEFRAARDIFVRQSPTVRQSRTSRTSRPTPTLSDESDSVWATGRDTRVEPRDESNTTASARGGQDGRSRGVVEATRRAAAKKRGVYWCRTHPLCVSVGATKERRVDSWLRLYNLSRTVSDQL
jgi:hypothetical protein